MLSLFNLAKGFIVTIVTAVSATFGFLSQKSQPSISPTPTLTPEIVATATPTPSTKPKVQKVKTASPTASPTSTSDPEVQKKFDDLQRQIDDLKNEAKATTTPTPTVKPTVSASPTP